MSWARSTHRFVVALIAAGVVVQFFLAGAGAFGATSFHLHSLLGTLLLVLAAVAVALALIGRAFVQHTVFLLLAVVIQFALGVLGADVQAWLGAVHAVNALAVMGAAASLVRRAVGSGGRGSIT
jgi:hypothetical protein